MCITFIQSLSNIEVLITYNEFFFLDLGVNMYSTFKDFSLPCLGLINNFLNVKLSVNSTCLSFVDSHPSTYVGNIFNSVITYSYYKVKLFLTNNYVFVPNYPSYIWVIYTKYFTAFNKPIVKLILVLAISYILGAIYIWLKFITNNVYFILILVYSNLTIVNAHTIVRDVARNNRIILWVLFTIGNFLFFCINIIFDYCSFTIDNRSLINRILLGLLFLINIVLGVLGSNGTYFLLNEYINIYLSIILSFSATSLFSSLWFLHSIPPANTNYIIINSTFRAALEVFAFNSAAWVSYLLSNIWLSVDYPNYLGFIFYLLFLVLGTVLFLMEMSGAYDRSMMFLAGYGVCYTLMFISGAFYTNSLFNFFTFSSQPHYIRIIIMIISGIVTVILFPDVYRHRRVTIRLNESNYTFNSWRRAFMFCFTYSILFIAFVFFTGILNDYIMQ